MEKQTRPHNFPNLLVKDALRGVRFAVRKGGQIFASQEHPILPKPINDVTSGLARRVEALSVELESLSREALGGPFKKTEIPSSSFFEENSLSDGELDLRESARVLYFGLSFASKKLGMENVLISELLCLECLQKYSSTTTVAGDATPTENASQLFALALDENVIGIPPGHSSSLDHDQSKITVAALFAAVLWLFVQRDIGSTTENDILDLCCQIAQDEMARIYEKKLNGDAMQSLFSYYLNIV